MSSIHVLTGSGGFFQVVVHSPTPAGDNAVGVSYETALKNSGNNVTVMPIGSGPGEITPAEATLVSCGAIIETRATWQVNPVWSPIEQQENLANFEKLTADDAAASCVANFKFFGWNI